MNTILLIRKRKRTDFHRGALSLLLIGILLLAGCGMPGDPIVDNLYTQNVYPGTDGSYGVGSEDAYYEHGYFGHLHLNEADPFRLVDDALVYIELRPDLDFVTVQAHGKPTWVARGIIGGFSLPVYAANNEELFLDIHVPHRWDEASDILVHVHGYLDNANLGKRFNLQLSWESFADGDIIPATSNNLTAETLTGNAAQFQSYHVEFIIDYDIDSAVPIVASNEIHMRLRRIAATQDEIAGEVVITHIGVVFRRDKLGSPVP